MALLTDCIFTDVLAITLTIWLCIYAYFKWAFKYWKRKGLPYLEPTFPFGTMDNFITNRRQFGDVAKEQYDEAKVKGYAHVGLFNMFVPFYMPVDLQLIRNIITKDFDHFMDRGMYYNEKDDPLSAHLFNLDGVKWRNLRMKLTPTFTSGKIKMMFPTITECGKEMNTYIKKVYVNNEPVDIKDILGCFTTDVIASCAFGIECNSFKNTKSEFRRNLKKNFIITTPQLMRIIIGFIFPNFARRIGIKFLQEEVGTYFMGVIKDTVEYREMNNVIRKDFMQLLLNLKNNTLEEGAEYQHDGKSLTMNELAAQAFVFLAAGFETSSTTMTFCLYELAINQDIQNKLREEINSVFKQHHGNFTYEAIMEMKYLTQIIEETLRKYPPLPLFTRVCTADYKIPDTGIVIEKGTPLSISILGLHHDEDYFPDPDRFNPERFNEENKPKIPHYSYMPFGDGPRVCIGLRFGMMQVKVGLATLLKNYIFTLNNKTITPLKMVPSSVVLSPVGDIWLNVKKISEEAT